MKSKFVRFTIATVTGGLGMWILAGLWHNLVLPAFVETAEAHHEGLVLMLIAYFILAFMMTYLCSMSYKEGIPLLHGLRIGVVVGILWVFPHGLTMAGAHDTSVVYEIKNALWHVVEQGVGGIIIGLIYLRK